MAKNNHRFLIGLALLFSVAGCGELTLPEDANHDQPSTPGEEVEKTDTLIAQNDTARFYLSGIEIRDVMLYSYPTPSELITNPHYRLPTKLEVSAVLKTVPIPEGYWQSGQRILCLDDQNDEGVQIGSTHFGTGLYYTYVPNGTITRAGLKTKYCILPIRTERLKQTNENIIIEINDCWND